MPATLKTRAAQPVAEDPAERNAREVSQARLDYRAPDLLALKVRLQRLYARACWDWDSLKVVKAEVEARIRELTAIVDNPGPWVGGETWKLAMERLEAAEAERWALLWRMRTLARDHETAKRRAD